MSLGFHVHMVRPASDGEAGRRSRLPLPPFDSLRFDARRAVGERSRVWPYGEAELKRAHQTWAWLLYGAGKLTLGSANESSLCRASRPTRP